MLLKFLIEWIIFCILKNSVPSVRTGTERTGTEIRRFLLWKRTDRLLKFGNRNFKGSEEPTRSVRVEPNAQRGARNWQNPRWGDPDRFFSSHIRSVAPLLHAPIVEHRHQQASRTKLGGWRAGGDGEVGEARDARLAKRRGHRDRLFNFLALFAKDFHK
jgi:hypothetical protein